MTEKPAPVRSVPSARVYASVSSLSIRDISSSLIRSSQVFDHLGVEHAVGGDQTATDRYLIGEVERERPGP